MNKQLCILLVLAVLCSTVFAGKDKSKEKSKGSKEKDSKEKSDESKSEESNESSSKEVKSTEAPSTTAAAITDGETTTEAATEATTETATDAATEAATDAATDAVTAGPEPTANELKSLCKGVIIDMKAHPGNCNKFIICVLGKATIQSCGKNQVFNSEIKFCAYGDPTTC